MSHQPVCIPICGISVRITAGGLGAHHHTIVYLDPPSGAPRHLHDLVNANLSASRDDMSCQLHLQLPDHRIDPVFTVELYSLGQRYCLVNHMGVIQWFVEVAFPGPMGHTVFEDDFLSCKVQSVTWSTWNLLVYLQRAHMCLPIAGGTQRNKWWVVNLVLTLGVSPEDENTTFTTIWVKEDTKIARVFQALAGHAVEGYYSLRQHKWGPEGGEDTKTWYYDDALELGVLLNDSKWKESATNEIWLTSHETVHV